MRYALVSCSFLDAPLVAASAQGTCETGSTMPILIRMSNRNHPRTPIPPPPADLVHIRHFPNFVRHCFAPVSVTLARAPPCTHMYTRCSGTLNILVASAPLLKPQKHSVVLTTYMASTTVLRHPAEKSEYYDKILCMGPHTASILLGASNFLRRSGGGSFEPLRSAFVSI